MNNNPSMDCLLEQYRYHDGLFKNVLDGIQPAHAQKRLYDITNHMAWLVGNMVSVRFRLANALGLEEKEKFAEIFENHRPIQNHITYPDLAALLPEWERITPLLEKRLKALHKEQLLGEQPFNAPTIGGKNLYGTISFLINRESYVIGQLSLMRKAFGYEPMKYV